MFELFWTFGFIINGTPNIQKMKHGRMSIEDCRTVVETDTLRMHDWLRGVLRQPLDFPVAVRGECTPIQQDAAKRDD